MPRTRRAAARKPLTLGFAGSGTLDTKAIAPLLDDLVEGAEVTNVFIPVTDDLFTDALADVVEWCKAKDIPYTTLSDEDAAKKSDLKEVIDEAADDYDAGDDAVKGILELLAGDEADPVEDGRLVMFFDGDNDDDVAAIEEAEELEVPAFDMLDGLSPITFGDEDDAGSVPDGDGDETTPPAEEEPAPVPATSRRRRAAKAAEEEPDDADDSSSEVTSESREELLKLTLVELKKRAKATQGATTESLRGLQKPDVVDLLLGAEAEDEEAADEPDEAQAAPARGRRAKAPATPSEAVAEVEAGDELDDPTEAVFDRLRGQRETAQRIGAGVSSILRQQLELDEEQQQRIDVAAGALGAALMVFAEVVIVEVRKPKSPGRPRKDGSEAQPRQEPAEEAPKTRRRRSS